MADVIFIPQVKMGYEVTDMAKRGTYLARGIEAMWDDVYNQHSNENVVFGDGIDYRALAQRDMIEATQLNLATSRWAVRTDSTASSQETISQSWIQSMDSAPGICLPKLPNSTRGVCAPQDWYDALERCPRVRSCTASPHTHQKERTPPKPSLLFSRNLLALSSNLSVFSCCAQVLQLPHVAQAPSHPADRRPFLWLAPGAARRQHWQLGLQLRVRRL